MKQKTPVFASIISVLLVIMLLSVSCASSGASMVMTVTLDEAIREAAENIENRLEPGSIIALLNFDSPSEYFSEYVLEELSDFLVNSGKLVVVERIRLDLIRQEEQFQLSGEVSDESAQRIGQKLGAQAIVSGSVHGFGTSYRFRIKTLAVETAAVAASSAADIYAKDNKVLALLGGAKPVMGTAIGNITITSEIAGIIFVDGRNTGSRVKVGGSVTITDINTGATEVAVKEDNGRITRMPGAVMVQQGQTVSVVVARPVYDGFVWIQDGTFTMGSPANEPGRRENEGPQQQVTVSSFYMGKYEVTQKEWLELMETNPSQFKGDNLPVEGVTWRKAIEYCNKRSLRDGLTPVYTIDGTNITSLDRDADGYRLPTEAEWEYACRAGTTMAYNTGNTITKDHANYGWVAIERIFTPTTFRNRLMQATMPVGMFEPNPWGLYDMHGNVEELCWQEDYLYVPPPPPQVVIDSQGNATFTKLASFTVLETVTRGGSWIDSIDRIRSASRVLRSYYTISKVSTIGFRIVRSY